MTILFDGIASGMLLFLIGVGLSVTLGLMNIVNLAHGAFAMAGGYACVLAMARLGLPFLLAVPLAALVAAALGALCERILFRRIYNTTQLEQVLLTIGFVFVAMALTRLAFGPSQQPMRLPSFLQGQVKIGSAEIGIYRAFLVVLGLVVAAALQLSIGGTRFGARLRAAVDKPRVAEALGINVGKVFLITFAVGSGLAGLGGAVGVELLGLDPGFPLHYLIYFLMVVAVGGSGSVIGSLVAALLIGICDVAGKYWLPQSGAFIIYTVMVAALIIRPQGLFGKS